MLPHQQQLAWRVDDEGVWDEVHVPPGCGPCWLNQTWERDPWTERTEDALLTVEILQRLWFIDLSCAEVYCQRVCGPKDSIACNEWCDKAQGCHDPSCRLLHFTDAEAANAPRSAKGGCASARAHAYEALTLCEARAPESPRGSAESIKPFVPYTYYALWVGNMASWPRLLDLFLSRDVVESIPESAHVLIGKYGLHITLAKLPLMSCASAVENTRILNKVVSDWRRRRWKPILRMELFKGHRFFHKGEPGGSMEYLGGHEVRLANWPMEKIVEEYEAGRLFDTVPYVKEELERMLRASESLTQRRTAAKARLHVLEAQPWMKHLHHIGGMSIVAFTSPLGHVHESTEIMDLCMWLSESLHNHIRGMRLPGWDKGFHRIQGEEQFHMSFPVPFDITTTPSFPDVYSSEEDFAGPDLESMD